MARETTNAILLRDVGALYSYGVVRDSSDSPAFGAVPGAAEDGGGREGLHVLG